MQPYFNELTETIAQAAARLLHGYEPEALYALRVSSRRIRSLLKPLGSKQARRFRRTWGALARVTNRARDWDVFLRSAEALLPADDFARFGRDNAERIHRSHAAVVDMLNSPRWQAHFEAWCSYLQRVDAWAVKRNTPSNSPSLTPAVTKAAAVLKAAELQGDSRSWHAFRIAIKQLRYLAESALPADSAVVGDPGGPDQSYQQVIEDCKELQALLGAWHDCVVQSHLLVDLPPTRVHDTLIPAIRALQEQQLAAIRGAVADHPLFRAASGQSSEPSPGVNGS